MANSDKDILITPNKGQTELPEISFAGQDNVPIKLRVLDDNTLSFEGSEGQLFSINNNLTIGGIFSVNDVSGIPSISVDASGRIDLARYNGFVNIGVNPNDTDKQLAITGEMVITNPTGSTTPAAIHFHEGSTVTGNGAIYLGYDGPNFNDNSNFWFIRNSSNTNILSVTVAGGVGINTNNPRNRFHIFGTHGDTSMRLTLPAGNNGGGTGEVNMQLWVSEPGRTWDGGGIGLNVANYQLSTFPTVFSDSSNNYFPRINSAIGQAYIRFLPNGGRIEFSTMANDGTSYREQIHMLNGGIGINTTANVGTTYKLNVNGDVNFTGTLYQNGVEFTSIPSQDDTTRGAVLKSDGTSAYWDLDAEDTYSGGYVLRGYTLAGYRSSTAWRNVNRTDHASDTTYDLGDQITTSDAYTAGASNGTYAYVFHSGGNWNVDGNAINRFNMTTDTNSDITTTMANSMNRTSAMRSKFVYAYTFGNRVPNKFNLLTETATLTGWANTDGGGNLHGANPACGQGERRGWHNQGSAGSYLDFATETRASWVNTGTDGSNKTISSYTGFMYWNTGGGFRTSNPMSKRYDYSGSQVLTIAKFANSGEESYHTGELKGYMVGMYNGAQNNTGAIMNYQTNTYFTQTSVDSKGPAGRASAAGVEYGRGI